MPRAHKLSSLKPAKKRKVIVKLRKKTVRTDRIVSKKKKTVIELEKHQNRAKKPYVAPVVTEKIVKRTRKSKVRKVTNKKLVSGTYWGGKDSRGYFSNVEEELVREFKITIDKKRKDEIFKAIYPKIEYLITSIMYQFRIPQHFDDINSIKQDCIYFIYEGIHKFDPYKISAKTGKPSRFFSYCSVIVSNHLRQLIKKKHNQYNIDDGTSPEYMNSSLDCHGNVTTSMAPEKDPLISREEEVIYKEFFSVIKKNALEWRSLLTKENDIKVLDAINKVFEDYNRLDSFDKKEIYFLLKELTGLQPQQLNGALKNIQKLYRKTKENYYNDEEEPRQGEQCIGEG